MALDERIQYWVEVAEYDLETADAMLRTDRLLYVGFMCHLATEKMLKAHVAKATQQMPPKTHNLPRLANLGEIEQTMSDAHQRLLKKLTPLSVEARYPPDRGITKTLDKQGAAELLNLTQELIQWLTKQL